MKLDIIIQNAEVNFKSIIENELKGSVKKMYMFAGTVKETGFDIIEENIIDKKLKFIVYMGIDKKNTTKGLLEDMLSYSSDVYIYDNNELKEFEGLTLVIEKEKYASIYVSSSKVSENAFLEDVVMISKLTYDLTDASDKSDYKEKIKQLTAIESLGFEKLTRGRVQELVDTKAIFSNKQYEHNVKSIAELLGRKNTEKTESKKEIKNDEDINGAEFDIPTIDLKNDFMDMDIDISGVEEAKAPIIEEKKEEKKEKKATKVVEKVEKFEDEVEDDEEIEEVSDEVIDLDSMLISRAGVKLKEKKNEKKTKEKVDEFSEVENLKVKKLDLNNITNLIMELPAKQQNKKDLDIIKIPNYIKDLIPAFFEFPDNSTLVDDGGIQTRERLIQLEVVDCKNEKKYVENDSKIFQRKSQTFISILCPSLEKINYDEKDIVRIIKLSSDIYHVEIVTKDMQEYKIWSKIMNKELRASDRRYGIM